ncbi:LPD7 domain-containing protein, partial [Mycobacterium tuberculosis]
IRQDHITKRGTIIYRTANAAVRDDGQRLHVSRGAQIEGVVAALRLAHERYGDRLATMSLTRVSFPLAKLMA